MLLQLSPLHLSVGGQDRHVPEPSSSQRFFRALANCSKRVPIPLFSLIYFILIVDMRGFFPSFLSFFSGKCTDFVIYTRDFPSSRFLLGVYVPYRRAFLFLSTDHPFFRGYLIFSRVRSPFDTPLLCNDP